MPIPPERIVDANVVGLDVDNVCVTTGVVVVSFSGLISFCLGSISGSCFMTSGSPALTTDGAAVGSCMRVGGFTLLKSGIKTGCIVFSVNVHNK